VDYGTGIGAGVVLDGKLLYGRGCAAGEFGHTHIMEDGPVCKCGSYGCLEAVAGARAVQAKVQKALADGGNSQVLELSGGKLNDIDGWTVFKAARAGDKICSNAVAELAGCLGLGLANLVNLFNPSVIVLDHRLELAGQPLVDQVLQIVKRQALTYSIDNVAIRFARRGDEAGVLGVGLMILENHFEIPMLKPPRFLIEPVRTQPVEPGDMLPQGRSFAPVKNRSTRKGANPFRPAKPVPA
jgi:N-acetylglucosamine repressor